jgi:hypothetical protein
MQRENFDISVSLNPYRIHIYHRVWLPTRIRLDLEYAWLWLGLLWNVGFSDMRRFYEEKRERKKTGPFCLWPRNSYPPPRSR